MRNPLLPKHHNYQRSITCLGLAFLITSCSAQEIPEEPSTATPSDSPEETVVAEETAAPPPTPSAAPESSAGQSLPEISAGQSLIVQTESLLESFDQGTEYAVVRARLLPEGWVPVTAAEPGSFGVEREAYDAGFIEVSGCAGTGLGECRFDFEHPSEPQGLSITTYGGSELQFGDWTIYPATATEAKSDVTPTNNSAIAQERRSEIPTQFQGKWDVGQEGCDSLVSDGRLVIGPKKLQFFESSGTVSDVLMTGDLEMMVTAEYSGEGSTWTDVDTFVLSDDSASLTVNGSSLSTRSRCSS